MVLGIVLNFVGFDPIKVLIYSAVLNGIISPVMIFFIVQLSGDEKVMGDFKNKKNTNIFGWVTFILISLVSVGALISIFI